MKKYKLIKEYPGSPKLGTIVEKEFDTSFIYIIEESKFGVRYGVLKYHVEGNPEYWEEVIEKRFMVSTEDCYYYGSYEVLTVSSDFKPKEYEKLFDSRDEAEAYIFYNKPYLSLMDVLISFNKECCVSIEILNNLVKSKQNA